MENIPQGIPMPEAAAAPVFEITYDFTAQDYRECMTNYKDIRKLLLHSKKGGLPKFDRQTAVVLFAICSVYMVFQMVKEGITPSSVGQLGVISVAWIMWLAMVVIGRVKARRTLNQAIQSGIQTGELDRTVKFTVYADRIETLSHIYYYSCTLDHILCAVEYSNGVYIIFNDRSARMLFIPSRFFNQKRLNDFRELFDKKADMYRVAKQMELPQNSQTAGQPGDVRDSLQGQALNELRFETGPQTSVPLRKAITHRLVFKMLVFLALTVITMWIGNEHYARQMYLESTMLIILGTVFLLAFVLYIGLLLRVRKSGKIAAPVSAVRMAFFEDYLMEIRENAVIKYDYRSIKTLRRLGAGLLMTVKNGAQLYLPQSAAQNKEEWTAIEQLLHFKMSR